MLFVLSLACVGQLTTHVGVFLRTKAFVTLILLEVLFSTSLWIITLCNTRAQKEKTPLLLFFSFNLLGSLIIFLSLAKEKFCCCFPYGVLFKLSLFPVFIWLPQFLKGLTYFGVWWFVGLQKVSYFFLFGFLGGNQGLYPLLVVTAGVSVLLLLSSVSDFKSFLGFASVVDNANLIILYDLRGYSVALAYFIIYLLSLGILLFLLSNGAFILSLKVSFFTLIGFPPSPLFFFKVYF